VNPLKHIVDGVRAFFRGDLATSTAGWGLFWAAALVLVGVLVGTRTFRRESS
jgi:ABC-2 type transport system permease protein